MRTLLALSSFALVLAGSGCRSHTAGQCDCTNHPESNAISQPAANYPILGGTSVSNAPTTIAPSGIIGGSSAPTAMPGAMPGAMSGAPSVPLAK